jgi:GxxExxY protein
VTLDSRTEQLAAQIVDAAIKVHRTLGPGLLEGVYQTCFAHELKLRKITTAQEVALPIVYEDLIVNNALRLDMVVEDLIIVELKAVDQLLPVHRAQLLSYLRLSQKQIAFLLNFNVPLMKEGIHRFIL